VVKKQEEEEEEPVEEPKKEPLSLEELLAKKQAEEAARSKVRHLKFTLFVCSSSLHFKGLIYPMRTVNIGISKPSYNLCPGCLLLQAVQHFSGRISFEEF
jgi:hypothetical protein